MTGQSLAAASDAVTRNGKGNTALAASFIVAGSLVVIVGGLWLKYHLKKKVNNSKFQNAIRLENIKHKNRVEEANRKNELKKETIDYRRTNGKRNVNEISSDDLEVPYMDASVETYNEIVSGKDVVADDLRLGLRCFHIGEDCGLIGRTQIGKTSWVFQYSMALAKGEQENIAKLTPDWKLNQPMTVLYFAFEQDRSYFKAKYGRSQKDVPNLYIELKTSPHDFTTIKSKIIEMQSRIGNCKLLVVFDNITKMECAGKEDRRVFFKWLESYRKECASLEIPITYLKVFHTQGSYKDYMPLDATTNYGMKTDTYFTQSLVGFGMCKEGDGRQRYLKELKNKLEHDGEKQTLSIFKFADSEIPLYDYVGEADECNVLPSRTDLVRGTNTGNRESNIVLIPSGKRGRPIQKSITDDDYLQLYDMVKSKEIRSKEVEDVYHVSWKWVKKRVRQIQQRTQDIA